MSNTIGRRRLLALILTVLLAACDTEENPDPPLALRPGATVLFDAGATATGNLLTRQHRLVRVNDAVRGDGRIIVELVAGWTSLATFHPPAAGCSSCSTTIGSASGSPDYALLTTDDEGDSWQPRVLAAPTDSKVGSLYGSAGFHAADGRVTWVLLYRHNDAAFEVLRDVDLASGTILDRPELVQQTMYHARAYGSALGSRMLARAPGDTAGEVTWVWYEMGTGQIQRTTASVAAPSWALLAAGRSLDGQLFGGIGLDVAHGQACSLGHAPLTAAAPDSCVDFSKWPVWLKHSAVSELSNAIGTQHNLVVGDGLLWAVFVHQEQLYAIPLDAPLDPSRALALGKGSLTPDAGLHPRFGPYVQVGPRRLLALTKAGVQEIVLEPPCEPGSQCAKAALLESVVPLDGDQVLALWKVDTMGGLAHHEYIVARKETVVKKPFNQALPEPGTGPLAFYPSAKPAPLLMQRCAMAEICFPNTGTTWLGCFTRFAGLPASNPLLQSMLTGPALTCPELAYLWPEQALLGKPCKNGCVGNVLVQACDTNQNISQTEDCGRYSGICTTTAAQSFCSKAVPALPCHASGCIGDLLVGCDPQTQTGLERDCSLQDQRCGMVPGGQAAAGQWNCLPRVPLDPEDCGGSPGHPVDLWHSVCVGNRYLTWCGKGERQVIDCLALGGSGCVAVEPAMGACF
jgi:hypothetical protein